MSIAQTLLPAVLSVIADTSSLAAPAQSYIEIEPFKDEARQKCALNFGKSFSVRLTNGQLKIAEVEEPDFNAKDLPETLIAAIAAQGELVIPSGRSSAAAKTFKEYFAVDPNAVSAIAAFEDGSLVSFNKGAYGGSIWWFPESGKPQFLLGENGLQMIRRGDDVYVLAIPGRRIVNASLVYRISRSEKSADWRSTKILRALGFPHRFMIDGDNIILASNDGPIFVSDNLVMSQDGRADQSIRHLFIPNSIVRTDDGVVYVGARYGVNVYRNLPASFEPTWLVPASCADFTMTNSEADCRCVPASTAAK